MNDPLNRTALATQEPMVELLDATLRDGSYAVDFHFDPSFVAELLAGLDGTGLSMIELGHGVGVEAELDGWPPCSIGLSDWCRLANSNLSVTPWGVFAQPSFTRISTLRRLFSEGMSFVRLGMEAHKVEENLDYVDAALACSDKVYLNLMKTSVTPLGLLAEHLRNVPREIAGVYVVDSYGTMLPQDVREYIEILTADFPMVGFHGHNNLGLANANSLEAVAAGAGLIDGTLYGIGRGSGNATTEGMAGLLARKGKAGLDYRTLARMAQFCSVQMQTVASDRYMQVLGGVIGVHTGLFPTIERLCSEFSLDAVSLMEHALTLSAHDPKESDLVDAAHALVASRSIQVPLHNTMVHA